MKKSLGRIAFILLALVLSCIKDPDFEVPVNSCPAKVEANINFEELESLYKGETLLIQDNLILEGFVISSDIAGNFFNVIHIQDKPSDPTYGIQLEMEQSQSNLFYPVGSKLLIKLKGLYLGKSGETLKLGGTFTSFGNLSVGRLPTLKVREHLLVGCGGFHKIQPSFSSISELNQLALNTLVRLENLEVVEEELGETYAIAEEETIRTLKDCDENQIKLITSGYSDFQSEILPHGNGSITGILQKDGANFQLIIRELDDIDFNNDRCPEIITEFTSTQILISELADPDNNSGARFVELYNAGDEPLDLNQWTLLRYTNDNTEIGSEIDLSGFILEAGGTLVISPNAEEFELVYGFAPDLGISTNSPADSNGDDNLELVDPFGTVIDAFGIVGEDGSGTNHEFEDGRALRNIDVIEANPTYTFSEWTIYNDTGDAGTTKQPQNAPENFTPKQHN